MTWVLAICPISIVRSNDALAERRVTYAMTARYCAKHRTAANRLFGLNPGLRAWPIRRRDQPRFEPVIAPIAHPFRVLIQDGSTRHGVAGHRVRGIPGADSSGAVLPKPVPRRSSERSAMGSPAHPPIA